MHLCCNTILIAPWLTPTFIITLLLSPPPSIYPDYGQALPIPLSALYLPLSPPTVSHCCPSLPAATNHSSPLRICPNRFLLLISVPTNDYLSISVRMSSYLSLSTVAPHLSLPLLRIFLIHPKLINLYLISLLPIFPFHYPSISLSLPTTPYHFH